MTTPRPLRPPTITGLPFETRIEHLLHGRVERIHVDVEIPAHSSLTVV